MIIKEFFVQWIVLGFLVWLIIELMEPVSMIWPWIDLLVVPMIILFITQTVLIGWIQIRAYRAKIGIQKG